MRYLWIISILVHLSFANNGPIVSTNLGMVQGFEEASSSGKVANVFLGIPFAEPPVGELRFEKPQRAKPWRDVYQATEFGNDCTPHYGPVAKMSEKSGEDCLTLNIIAPKDAKNLPVLVWIHGGGYSIGAASHHGYKVFVEDYAPNGVIVVSIQYRLGFMGFFTDGERGNMGLFDQAMALKFVKENIAKFGGDNNKVTIWGYSAGAASASQLSISPHTYDLYNQAIIMSASSYAGWATGSTVLQHSKELAAACNCEWSDAIKCLKKKSVDELFACVDVVAPTTPNIDILKWSPVLDKDFFVGHPDEMLTKVKPKPTVIGLSDKEGTYFTIQNLGNVISSFGVNEEQMQKIDKEFLRTMIRDRILYGDRFENEKEAVVSKILDFYLKTKKSNAKSDKSRYIDAYSEILSDITFNVPVVREIKKRIDMNTPLWAYKFEHFNDAIWKSHIPDDVKGSPHANEYNYLFEMPMLGEYDKSSDEEKRVKKNLIDMVITFAKNGTPQVEDIEWKPLEDYDELTYMNFATKGPSIKKNDYFKDAATFWQLLRHDHGFDVIDPTTTPPQVHTPHHDEL